MTPKESGWYWYLTEHGRWTILKVVWNESTPGRPWIYKAGEECRSKMYEDVGMWGARIFPPDVVSTEPDDQPTRIDIEVEKNKAKKKNTFEIECPDV